MPVSSVGGVVVIRKSPRSLLRERSATTEMTAVVDTRSTPWIGRGMPGKNSLRKPARWPDAGSATAGLVATEVPFRVRTSRVTVVAVLVVLAIANPVSIAGAVDASAYMRKDVPMLTGTPASDKVNAAGL